MAAFPPGTYIGLTNLLHENEINLPLFQVNSRHEHAHSITQPELTTAALPLQCVLLFVEDVVVVIHRADVHEPLHVVVVEQNEKTEGSNTADRADKLVAEVTLHELNLLELDA